MEYECCINLFELSAKFRVRRMDSETSTIFFFTHQKWVELRTETKCPSLSRFLRPSRHYVLHLLFCGCFLLRAPSGNGTHERGVDHRIRCNNTGDTELNLPSIVKFADLQNGWFADLESKSYLVCSHTHAESFLGWELCRHQESADPGRQVLCFIWHIKHGDTVWHIKHGDTVYLRRLEGSHSSRDTALEF